METGLPGVVVISGSKKTEKTLTFQAVSDIIDTQIKKVMNEPPRLWGFKREEIVRYLTKIKESIKEYD